MSVIIIITRVCHSDMGRTIGQSVSRWGPPEFPLGVFVSVATSVISW